MSEIDLILHRRREVEQGIARLRGRFAEIAMEISEFEAELVELDTAGRVMARLSGAEWPAAGAANELPKAGTPIPVEESAVKMTAPDMIEEALLDARRRGLRGLAPKAIYRYIAEHYSPEFKGEYISSICWRMWKHQGRLFKEPNSPIYYLADKESTADLLSPAGEQSAVVDQPGAQGGEAPPGGGT